MPALKYGAIQRLSISDSVVRLRCLAAAADPAAIPGLEGILRDCRAREQKWAEAVASGSYSHATVKDLYETRLLRPFAAYALLRCGKRDAATREEFVRGCVELPYYAWRQRWILESAGNALAEAGQMGDPAMVSAAKLRIKEQERFVRRLDRAVMTLSGLFTPDVVGREDAALRGAATVMAAADCAKSLPLCYAFLRALTPAERRACTDLRQARLEPLRLFYAGL